MLHKFYFDIKIFVQTPQRRYLSDLAVREE
jgi:hypothetical protein